MGNFANMNFDFICKISLEFSKMGITFPYEFGLKSFLYEKSSTRKVTSEFTSGAPFARCTTSNRKKLVSNFFFGKNVQNMIRNMTGKFEIFFQNFITLMNMNKVLNINKV